MKTHKGRTKKLYLITAAFIVVALIGALLGMLIGNLGEISILQPKGRIAADQRSLLIFGTVLSLIVVVPVYALTVFIAVKYRASNHKATHKPDWDHSRLLESIWWGVPLALILILSVVTWRSSYDLDPGKPIAAKEEQMTVQVVSMNWKWLFIYPEEKIATVNYLQLPVDKPVKFEITGDSAMNSFWIPSLGGQIYAMPGMSTNLHLQADQVGKYRGSSANISGRGFSGMDFTTNITSQHDYDNWVKRVKNSPIKLSDSEYQKLRQPTENNPAVYYSFVQNDLFSQIIRGYLLP